MRLIRRVLVVIAALLAVGGGMVLLPRQLGGATTYVITNGVSMQPGIRTGDLVVARPANRYDVGDVIAYRSSELRTTVLHRVIERDGDRFVTKGDYNGWVDPEHPQVGQVLGRMWVRVPGGGKLLGTVRKPAVLGGFAAITLLGAAHGLGGRRPTRPHNRPQRRASKMDISLTPTACRQAAAALAVVAIVAGGASLAAWTTPAERLESDTAQYTHHGAFSYHAPVSGALAYDDGTVDTGEPVFVRLVRTVTVGFSYHGDSVPAGSSGLISMVADVMGSGGWQRTTELAAPRPFTGSRAEVAAKLDLGHINELSDEIDRQTGTSPGTRTVTLRPTVTFAAESGTSTAFAPSVAFRLDAVAFRLAELDAAHRMGTPITVDEAGSVSLSTKAANRVVFLAWTFSVMPARTATTGAAVLAALAASLAAGAAQRARRLDIPRDVVARHAERIVRAERVDAAPGPTVEVADFDALAQLAEHGDHLIVHLTGDDEFYVHSHNTQYRFRPRRSTTSAVAAPYRSSTANGPPLTATGRTLALLETLGPEWKIVRGPALAGFAIDAVASGPGGILGIVGVAVDGEWQVAGSGPLFDRLREGVDRLERELERTRPGLPNIVPAVVFWTPGPRPHADAVAVDNHVLLLDGHSAEEWRGELQHRHLPDASIAAVADAVGAVAGSPQS